MKKVIIFTPCGISNPSTRIRGYNLAKHLSDFGLHSQVIMNAYQGGEGNFVQRILCRLMDFASKIMVIAKSDKQTVVYIQRGVYLGLSNFSLFLCLFSKFILRKKVIYDIDDGLFLFDPFPINNLLKFSDAVIVGGHHLFNYAQNYNRKVFLIPPSVDLTKYLAHDNIKKHQGINLGFVGSKSTTKNMKLMLEPLEVLAKCYAIELTVISAQSYADYEPFNPLFEEFKKRGIKVNLVPWEINDEFYQLGSIDIGLDPLSDKGWEAYPSVSNEEWTKYKCGFKIINYMAAGIPAVASNISENTYIIQNGVNGFLCGNSHDWITNLRKLIEDEQLRKVVSARARKTVEEKYCLKKNARILAEIIKLL